MSSGSFFTTVGRAMWKNRATEVRGHRRADHGEGGAGGELPSTDEVELLRLGGSYVRDVAGKGSVAHREGWERGLHRGPHDVGGDHQGSATGDARFHHEQVEDKYGMGVCHSTQLRKANVSLLMRIRWIMNQLAVLGYEYKEEEVVRWFLLVLPHKFEQIAHTFLKM
jgi:hypothetical protein